MSLQNTFLQDALIVKKYGSPWIQGCLANLGVQVDETEAVQNHRIVEVGKDL